MTERNIDWRESDRQWEESKRIGFDFANKIVDAVSDDKLPIGQLLHTYDFSDALGQERSNVRNVLLGLSVLNHNGVIINYPGKGSWIRPRKPKEAEDSLKFLTSGIERYAIDTLASLSQDHQSLIDGVRKLDELSNNGDNTSFVRQEVVYRSEILRKGGYGHVAKEGLGWFAEPIIFRSRQNQEYLPFKVPSLDQEEKDAIVADHYSILDRILAGDSDGAVTAHQSHVQRKLQVYDRRFAGHYRNNPEVAKRIEEDFRFPELPIGKNEAERNDFGLPILFSYGNQP